MASLRADLPPVVEELRLAVDTFKMRLETTEHLSWLGESLPASFTSVLERRLIFFPPLSLSSLPPSLFRVGKSPQSSLLTLVLR